MSTCVTMHQTDLKFWKDTFCKQCRPLHSKEHDQTAPSSKAWISLIMFFTVFVIQIVQINIRLIREHSEQCLYLTLGCVKIKETYSKK